MKHCGHEVCGIFWKQKENASALHSLVWVSGAADSRNQRHQGSQTVGATDSKGYRLQGPQTAGATDSRGHKQQGPQTEGGVVEMHDESARVGRSPTCMCLIHLMVTVYKEFVLSRTYLRYNCCTLLWVQVSDSPPPILRKAWKVSSALDGRNESHSN